MITVRQITSRDEWLGWRKEVLTASDIGAVVGCDKYKTPLQVYADKTTDLVVEESPIMRRGRMFEMAAMGYLAEDHPDWDLYRPGAFYAEVDIRLGATPDALARTAGKLINCQIKTVSAPVFEAWDGEPPQSYLLQTVCENMLTHADHGILAVLVVSAYGAEMHEFPVPRHRGAEGRIYDIARQFWKNVKAGLVPRPVYAMDGEVIAGMYQPDEDVPVPLDLSADNRIHEVLTQRESLKSEIKLREESVKALDAELVHKLAGATLATCNGWKITNRIQTRKSYVVPENSFPVLRTFNLDKGEKTP